MRRPLLLAVALLVSACSRELVEADGFVQPDLSGSVRIPLSTTGPDGTLYRLRAATLEISGSAMLTLSASPHRPAAGAEAPRSAREQRDDALTAPLPAGTYSLFLRSGFQLVEVDAEGVERPVEARFVTPNPTHFELGQVEDATLKLAFERAGQTLVFGVQPALRITSAR